ncbi:GvpL/GvpF family gas vesicle protein [Dactylosporangium darangshiense]|uniref:GvpL/GvpF family gas vesicle protein n=1 Tax=Dactylosporangium darangshiense TaxID=579108 RepID=A0ABP8DDY3_9ACTN
MPTATGIYVYGIVPADVETEPEARGVGEDAARISVVRHDRIGALVSEIPLDRPLGTPDDLLAHERLLDAVAGVVPVLPMRFGAVLTDRQATVDELLAPHHDEFDTALRELEGLAEYLINARYVQDAILREVLAEDPELERRRAALRGRPDEETHAERIALGEAIGGAVDVHRDVDASAIAEALVPVVADLVMRPPPGEFDVAAVAVLAETGREKELVHAVQELARRWAGRVEVRLLGPVAPYDFTAEPRPEE